MSERETERETERNPAESPESAGSSHQAPSPPAVMDRTSMGAVIPAGEEVRGLSPNQRRFLALRLLHATDVECAAAIGMHRNSVSLWKLEPEFITAYNALWSDGALEEWAAAQKRRLIGKALLTAEDLMDAQGPVRTKDGVALDGDGQVVMAPDNLARAKGAELVFRVTGMWQPESAGAAPNPVSEALAALREVIALRRVELDAPPQTQQARIIDVTPSP